MRVFGSSARLDLFLASLLLDGLFEAKAHGHDTVAGKHVETVWRFLREALGEVLDVVRTREGSVAQREQLVLNDPERGGIGYTACGESLLAHEERGLGRHVASGAQEVSDFLTGDVVGLQRDAKLEFFPAVEFDDDVVALGAESCRIFRRNASAVSHDADGTGTPGEAVRLAEGVVLFDLVAVVFTDQVGDAELRAFIIVEEEDAVALEGIDHGHGNALGGERRGGGGAGAEIAEGGGADVFLTGGGGGRTACEPECRSGGSGTNQRAARDVNRHWGSPHRVCSVCAQACEMHLLLPMGDGRRRPVG